MNATPTPDIERRRAVPAGLDPEDAAAAQVERRAGLRYVTFEME